CWIVHKRIVAADKARNGIGGLDFMAGVFESWRPSEAESGRTAFSMSTPESLQFAIRKMINLVNGNSPVALRTSLLKIKRCFQLISHGEPGSILARTARTSSSSPL